MGITIGMEVVVMKSLSDILTGPDKWTKGRSAADIYDNVVLSSSRSACKFCIGGAINRLGSGYDDECFVRSEIRKSIRKLFPCRGGQMHDVIEIEAFNDHPDTTFEDVMKVIEDSGC